jgi:type VI secretion system protein ImpK
VLAAFKPIAERIAKTLDEQKGFIKIVGHTDNTPISHGNVRFPSNYHLSVERAKAVAALLRPLLAEPDRLQIDGKGETAPVDDNRTPEGRAKNRRVEFLIPRTDPGVVAQRTCQR